jgi:hypothetical protein
MPVTVDDVRQRTLTDDRDKWDVLADPRDLLLVDGRLAFQRPYGDTQAGSLRPGTWATGQMCRRLGIPTPYFRRCPPFLQDRQFNHWLRDAPQPQGSAPRASDKWFLRCKGDALRGVLSERYSCLDNADLMRSLEPALDSRYRVGWFALTEESFHLRLLDYRLAREVLPNDRLVAGIHVANSEVGKRAVTVDALVYRLVCTNGLIRLVRGASLMNRRHVSLSRPQFEAGLQQAIRDALVSGVGFMERLAVATTEPVQDVDRTIRRFSTQWALSQTTEANIRQALLTEPRTQQETVYGLVNAVTNAAQALPADDRYSLEALASTLLDGAAARPARVTIEPMGERQELDPCT